MTNRFTNIMGVAPLFNARKSQSRPERPQLHDFTGGLTAKQLNARAKEQRAELDREHEAFSRAVLAEGEKIAQYATAKNAAPPAAAPKKTLLETYADLQGEARQKFFSANKTALWEAYRATKNQ